MTEKQILTISIQIAAMLFLIYMLHWVNMVFGPLTSQPAFGETDGRHIFTNPYFYLVLILYIAPVLIWFHPDILIPASVKTSSSQDHPHSGSNFETLQYTLNSTLGLYVLGLGLVSLVFRLVHYRYQIDGLTNLLHPQILLEWVPVILRITIGIFLVIHPKKILAVICNWRHITTIE